MENTAVKHSQAWINFTFLSFGVSVGMMSLGIFFLPLDMPVKGFLAMASLMMIQSSVTVTKTLRDNQEAGKFVNKVEEAKTERLLMGIRKGPAE